ncbi:hypothetical protein LRU_01535 [Ligilactobacillus ruminis SPM0211]|uniref:Uncharacterized protein n=1 Tax=Ligilactobacillus ruminis SPM0211 TaxID=1040964 RepID=F7R1G6_9LACO|nr:hypothetical protein LRU_01535 [Ligilactobacillus ruminis SPM0211]
MCSLKNPEPQMKTGAKYGQISKSVVFPPQCIKCPDSAEK